MRRWRLLYEPHPRTPFVCNLQSVPSLVLFSQSQRRFNAYFLCPNLGNLNGSVRKIVATDKIAAIMNVARNE